MYIIIISSAIVGKVNAVSIVNKKNTQHKLNKLPDCFSVCLFVLQEFFSKIQENAKKNSWSPRHLIGLPA